jgi:hypothetical protein
VSRSTKKAKKSKEADVALEAHEPASSSNDVSDHTIKLFSLRLAYTYMLLPLSDTDEEICRLGY